VEKSNEFPFASTPEFSPPVAHYISFVAEGTKRTANLMGENHVNQLMIKRNSPLRTPWVKEVSVRVGLVGLVI
jgi:hypothetical protein